MIHDWFWQLQAAGQGPDWFFSATFAQADADQLAALVLQQALPDFAHYRVTNGLCRRHQHTSSYDLYVDQGNYAALVANLEGDQSQNIWIYHTIEVCGHDLAIERGYGGYPGSHGAAETDLIVMLARVPELSAMTWEVGYGGQGYPAGRVAAGTTAAEFLAYLAL